MYDNISECHCVIVWSHSQVKILWYFKTSVLRELNILHHCVSTFTFRNIQFFFSHIPRILVTAKLSYFQNFHSLFSISRPNLVNLTHYYLLEKNIFFQHFNWSIHSIRVSWMDLNSNIIRSHILYREMYVCIHAVMFNLQSYFILEFKWTFKAEYILKT